LGVRGLDGCVCVGESGNSDGETMPEVRRLKSLTMELRSSWIECCSNEVKDATELHLENTRGVSSTFSGDAFGGEEASGSGSFTSSCGCSGMLSATPSEQCSELRELTREKHTWYFKAMR
jgi:hypothetical protein